MWIAFASAEIQDSWIFRLMTDQGCMLYVAKMSFLKGFHIFINKIFLCGETATESFLEAHFLAHLAIC